MIIVVGRSRLDSDQHVIRQVTPTGYVKTIAGTPGVLGAPTPTPAPGLTTHFHNPSGLAYDGSQTLFVADTNNNVLCAIDLSTPDFSIRTLAGDGIGYNRGTLYVADTFADLIRRVDLTDPLAPQVYTLAGQVGNAGSAGTRFTDAQFFSPLGLALDPATGKTLWVADSGNQTVRRLDLGKAMVSTEVGVPLVPRTRPGPLPGNVHTPWGVVVTPRGLVITSYDENTVLLARNLQ